MGGSHRLRGEAATPSLGIVHFPCLLSPQGVFVPITKPRTSSPTTARKRIAAGAAALTLLVPSAIALAGPAGTTVTFTSTTPERLMPR
jgi:hypothetical protein